MDKLTKYLVDGILKENEIKNIVVVYSGRFQPFHKGHYGTYSHLVKKFGKDNVFIGTSDKVEKPKSPLNFNEKVKVMTTMFGIPKNKIVQIKNPYSPKEILSKFPEETTAYITVVGEKDSDRLSRKYFKTWKGKAEVGYKDGGYVYVAPSSGGGVSGTEVRNGLSVGSDEEKKNFFKNRAYPKFNPEIFKLITNKLSEGVLEIKKEWIEDWLINESTLTGVGQDDDGPGSFLPPTAFPKVSMERAAKIGYQVIDSALKPEIEGFYDYPTYPDGPVAAVSFFPAGVIGKTTATNQIDLYNKDAYIAWFQHATRWATLTGYKLVRNVITKDVQDDIKDFAVSMAQNLEDYFEDEYDIDVQSNKKFDLKSLGLSKSNISDESRLQKIREDINVSQDELDSIERYADKVMHPIDVDFSPHFFDQLQNKRNRPDISIGELIRFFNRLKRRKKDLISFLNKFREVVATDDKTNINIPFLKKSKQAIAKTIMRKRDFKTYDPVLNFEGLSGNMSLEDIAKKHKVKVSDLSNELDMGIEVEKEHTSDKSVATRIALDHLFEDPKYYTKLKKIENPVTEAQAVSGGKIHKFITGKNLTLKGKKYPDIEFEVLGVDNRSQLVKLRVLAPKSIFGHELNVPFKTIRRGPFIKTDTSKLENLGHGYPEQEWVDNHEKKMKKLRKQLDKQ